MSELSNPALQPDGRLRRPRLNAHSLDRLGTTDGIRMKKLYCWRCKLELPMLDEQEWTSFEPVLRASIASVKAYRERQQTSLADTPVKQLHQPALDLFEKITGFRETNPNALWHHRLLLYGPPCHHCGRPLRTPEAKLCGACMAPREAV